MTKTTTTYGPEVAAAVARAEAARDAYGKAILSLPVMADAARLKAVDEARAAWDQAGTDIFNTAIDAHGMQAAFDIWNHLASAAA